MTRTRRVQILIGLGLLAVLAVVLVIALSGGDDEATVTTPEATATETAQIPMDGMTMGKASAPELEEFIDPQCPFCAMFGRQVLPTLQSEYVQPGKIKMTLHPLAFLGNDSLPAAQAVAAAGLQDKAWPYVEVFFANQGEENSGYVTDEFLRQVGEQVDGLDVDKMMADRSSPEVKQILDDADKRAEEVGLDSTPFFVLTVDGETRKVPSNLEAPQFKENLDAALGQ